MFKTSTQKKNNNKTVIYLYDHNEIAKCQIPPYIVKLTPFLLGHRVAFFFKYNPDSSRYFNYYFTFPLL